MQNTIHVKKVYQVLGPFILDAGKGAALSRKRREMCEIQATSGQHVMCRDQRHAHIMLTEGRNRWRTTFLPNIKMLSLMSNV